MVKTNITQQIFHYQITTTGINGCSDIASGSITVNPEPAIVLNSSSPSVQICEGVAVDPILYQLTEGAVGAVVTGLPPGLNYSIDTSTKVITISGTPTSDVSTPTEFPYLVTTNGSLCPPASGEVSYDDATGNNRSGVTSRGWLCERPERSWWRD